MSKIVLRKEDNNQKSDRRVLKSSRVGVDSTFHYTKKGRNF